MGWSEKKIRMATAGRKNQADTRMLRAKTFTQRKWRGAPAVPRHCWGSIRLQKGLAGNHWPWGELQGAKSPQRRLAATCPPSPENAEQHRVGESLLFTSFPKVPLQQELGWGHRLTFLNFLPSDDG